MCCATGGHLGNLATISQRRSSTPEDAVEQARLFAYALASAHRPRMNTRDELLPGQRVWVLDRGTLGGKAWGTISPAGIGTALF